MHQIELNCYVRENLSARKCQIGLDARKFSSVKISTFTVIDSLSGLRLVREEKDFV